jgi:hypothetical protein
VEDGIESIKYGLSVPNIRNSAPRAIEKLKFRGIDDSDNIDHPYSVFVPVGCGVRALL